MKYYAVKKGRETGLFTTWGACEAQVKGFSGAVYKSFKTEKEAQEWLSPDEVPVPSIEEFISYVDGSYDKVSGRYSYGLVWQYQGEMGEAFGIGEDISWQRHHNVAGEVLGALKAMSLAKAKGAKKLVLYHDYIGIATWAKGEWKANFPMTQYYQKACQDYFACLEVSFVKVRAHSGDKLNDRADLLAKKALKEG